MTLSGTRGWGARGATGPSRAWSSRRRARRRRPCVEVLEELEDSKSTPVRLWPEQFDIAIELGDEAAAQRAKYGFSPGDDDHDEPYSYVGPWTADVTGELWRATGSAALRFFTTRRDALA